MADQPQVEALGEHNYAIRVGRDGSLIELHVHASPDVVARLPVDTDELRLIEATAAYLIGRQRADDLPASLDLDDVHAAYAGYLAEIATQLATGVEGR